MPWALIGNDAYGDYLVEECRRYPNVNVDQLRRTDLDATSFTDVFSIKASGRRTFFHYRGTNRLFEPAHVDIKSLPVKMFHLGYLLLMDAMDQPDAEFGTVAARFLAQLQRHNIRTSIDLVSENSDRFRHIVPPALKYTDYCIINDWEAEKLTGIPLRPGGKLLPENLGKIGETIFGFGVKDLVVVHFPEGGYLLSKDGVELLQPSLELPDDYVVGSAGAGDSFCAGILYGLYHGWSHDKTASLCHLRRWDELEQLDHHGWHQVVPGNTAHGREIPLSKVRGLTATGLRCRRSPFKWLVR